jgi:hypothetical protein
MVTRRVNGILQLRRTSFSVVTLEYEGAVVKISIGAVL